VTDAIENGLNHERRDPSDSGQRQQVVPAAQLGIEGGRFDERAYLGQVAGRRQDVTTQDQALAARRADQPEKHPDGGGLAGAVGADDPHTELVGMLRSRRSTTVRSPNRLVSPVVATARVESKSFAHGATPIVGGRAMGWTVRNFVG